MKFGKEFRIHLEETMPEWRDKFLCYKVLKKLLKNIPPFPLPPLPPPPQHRQEEEEANDPSPGSAAPQVEGDGGGNHQYPAIVNHVNLQDWFVRILDEELEKFNDFYVDKEEEFVIRLQDLKERIENMNAKNNETGVLAENERSEEMLEIRKAFVTIHGEMVLLKNYSSLNFAALVKILKKYDKRTGDLLRLPFTQRALNQPFFTTEPLTSLVRECEANLELLFPVEAEVIEPTRQSDPQCTTQARAESSIHEGNADVYRGTLAAMRAIQGLRGASSTYNPLSLGQFFHDQDGDDGSGALTAESSLTNSPADSHKGNHDEPPSAEGAEITVAPLEKT